MRGITSIVEEYALGNSIDWNETIFAVYFQHEYNRLKAEGEMEEKEVISAFEDKYKLPYVNSRELSVFGC